MMEANDATITAGIPQRGPDPVLGGDANGPTFGICPATGYWTPDDSNGVGKRHFNKGQHFPPVDGHDVVWIGPTDS
jgi:hypothetical protein